MPDGAGTSSSSSSSSSHAHAPLQGAGPSSSSSSEAAPFAIGALVYVPRSRGQYESMAWVVDYDATRGLYTVEVETRGSGNCKICSACFLSAKPMGERWAAILHEAVAIS